jgi:hypothetical protein
MVNWKFLKRLLRSPGVPGSGKLQSACEGVRPDKPRRIQGMAAAHELLSQGNWQGVRPAKRGDQAGRIQGVLGVEERQGCGEAALVRPAPIRAAC